ncbi:hypothetical protein BKA70DRAFT_1121219, partial [Coprinopsis sp. MPI-PUGE-AT-0042]
EHWVLNNGPKFLYRGLTTVRLQRLAMAVSNVARWAIPDLASGCIAFEPLDYQAKKSKDTELDKPDLGRFILHPSPEALYSSPIEHIGKHWTLTQSCLYSSSNQLVTAPPPCLDPTPQLTRIANHVLRASTSTAPMSLKRKVSAHEPEGGETEKTRRTKVMTFRAPRNTRQHEPNLLWNVCQT